MAVGARCCATLAALALGRSATAVGVGAVMFVPTAFVLVCCAALSATNDPYAYLLTPQLGYLQSAAADRGRGRRRGPAPVLAAREAAAHGGSADERRRQPVEVVLLAIAAAMAWWLGKRMADADARWRHDRRGGRGVRGPARSWPPAASAATTTASWPSARSAVEIGAGEMVALVGPNGAGKTTFLTIAAGLLEPSSRRDRDRRRAGRHDRRPAGRSPTCPTRRSSTKTSASASTSNTWRRCTASTTAGAGRASCWSGSGSAEWDDSLPPNSATGCARRPRSRSPWSGRSRSCSPTSPSTASTRPAATSSSSCSPRPARRAPRWSSPPTAAT